MVDVPATEPVTTPTLASAIVALPLSLLQVPVPVASDNVVVEPTHTLCVPVIAVIGLTVTTAIDEQPVPSVYVILDVPATAPAITPTLASAIVAFPLLLLQVPPLVASDNVVVEPTHTLWVPVIAVIGLTVTTAVDEQPVPSI